MSRLNFDLESLSNDQLATACGGYYGTHVGLPKPGYTGWTKARPRRPMISIENFLRRF